MIIGKKPGWPIISLIHLRPIVSPLIKTRREIKVTVTVFIQIARMVEPLPLALILLKSKNKTTNSKNDKTLPRSNAITVKRWAIIPLSVLTKSQKSSFNYDNLFTDDSSYYESCFSSKFLFRFSNLYY